MPRQRSQRPSAGFTLVELLAVIAIIALLIGILIPAVSVIRTKGKTVSTQATIGSLGAGIEAFRSENRLGGGYPPSASDGSGSLEYKVNSPYVDLGIGGEIEISGAGLLLWALSGADLLGAPGFRTFRTSSTEWAEDTDNLFNSGTPRQSGAYALFPDGNDRASQPVHARFGPYVDDKVRVSQYNAADSTFEIAAETEAVEDLGNDPTQVQRDYPMYLDAFGFPLLYYRADPAGVVMYDEEPAVPRGIYHSADNRMLVEGSDPLVLNSGNTEHNLNYTNLPSGNPSSLTDPFAYFIWNQSVAARKMPHNAQTYLLFSPGPDGRYGTSDDIGNFKQSGG